MKTRKCGQCCVPITAFKNYNNALHELKLRVLVSGLGCSRQTICPGVNNPFISGLLLCLFKSLGTTTHFLVGFCFFYQNLFDQQHLKRNTISWCVWSLHESFLWHFRDLGRSLPCSGQTNGPFLPRGSNRRRLLSSGTCKAEMSCVCARTRPLVSFHKPRLFALDTSSPTCPPVRHTRSPAYHMLSIWIIMLWSRLHRCSIFLSFSSEKTLKP